MDPLMLQDIALILVCGSIVLFFCRFLKIPFAIGFLLTGVMTSNQGLHLISYEGTIQTFADVGVILLLFSIGMELSIPHIKAFRKDFFLGGLLQVTLTTLVGIGIGVLVGRPWGESIFLGWIISLSSTAIVGKVLSTKMELDTPQGIMAFAICVFQDVITIPMILLTPYLAHPETPLNLSWLTFLQHLALLFFFTWGAVKFLPTLFSLSFKPASHELFLTMVLAVCFGTSWIAHEAGLPLPIGAFLAGLFLANVEHRHQAISDITALKEIFLGAFFLSLGLLLDLQFLMDHIALVGATAFLLIFGKTVISTLVGGILGLPFRESLVVGLALAQIGEFSFVLLRTAQGVGIGTDFYNQLFLNVALLTMAATVILIERSRGVIDFLSKLPMPHWLFVPAHPLATAFPYKKGHILVVGYGTCGKLIIKESLARGFDCVLIEREVSKCREALQEGIAAHLGDATHPHALHQSNIKEASLAVVAVRSYPMAIRIAEAIREAHPYLPLLIRCRALREEAIPSSLAHETFFFDQHESAHAVLGKMGEMQGRG
jgi:CPA2 family monovalent cation:H+ antiporter-2